MERSSQPPVLPRRAIPLETEELRRYGRHLVLPGVGREGQERLKGSRVLIVGAGGLGGPAALYLAAAGVGTLGLVDDDRVDESNLQRQILFSTADVGRPKLEVAAERLAGVNPHVEIRTHELRLQAANALDVLAPYDLVIDGSDNFPTRYLVNDACVLSGKPDVYGAVHRFEGQAAVFWGAAGPCYRCLFDRPPPPELAPDCAEAGVLGVLPGIIGSLQASHAIELLLGRGSDLIGKLLVFDARRARWRELQVPKNPGCPVCSESPRQTELIDYEAFCASAAAEPSGRTSGDAEITPSELASRLRAGEEIFLLDVRTPPEHAIAHLEGARLIPLQELPSRLQELPADQELVVYCHHGPRSRRAVEFLHQRGLGGVRNLAGGIDAWSLEVDPEVPRY